MRELAEAIGVATNNVAEYRGLLAGLRWIAANTEGTVTIAQMWRLGWTPSWSSSRCQGIGGSSTRTCVRSRWPRATRTRPRWSDTPGFPGEANKRADSLVNESLDACAAGRDAVIDRAP